MKCPVCKNDIADGFSVCPTCGFNDIRTEFINTDEAVIWMDNVVIPYRKILSQKERDMSAADLAKSIESSYYIAMNSAPKKEKNVTQNIFEYVINEEGAAITKYNGTSKESIICPDEINGYVVYKISDYAFRGHTELEHITLPKHLSCIGKSAFLSSGIKSIVIPDTVQQIDTSAFSRTKIHELIFPYNVKEISYSVCKACDQLSTVIILGANTVRHSAFDNCCNLSKIVMANTVKEFESSYEFANKVTKLVFPSSLEKASLSGFLSSICFGRQKISIAIFNDDIELDNDYIEDCDPSVLILFCNHNSNAEKFAQEYDIQTQPLSAFPKD